MYRRPKFQELLIEIREQMARDCDYDMDLFAENIRSGNAIKKIKPPTETTNRKIEKKRLDGRNSD